MAVRVIGCRGFGNSPYKWNNWPYEFWTFSYYNFVQLHYNSMVEPTQLYGHVNSMETQWVVIPLYLSLASHVLSISDRINNIPLIALDIDLTRLSVGSFLSLDH